MEWFENNNKNVKPTSAKAINLSLQPNQLHKYFSRNQCMMKQVETTQTTSHTTTQTTSHTTTQTTSQTTTHTTLTYLSKATCCTISKTKFNHSISILIKFLGTGNCGDHYDDDDADDDGDNDNDDDDDDDDDDDNDFDCKKNCSEINEWKHSVLFYWIFMTSSWGLQKWEWWW